MVWGVDIFTNVEDGLAWQDMGMGDSMSMVGVVGIVITTRSKR
jgi:hypothetical protein